MGKKVFWIGVVAVVWLTSTCVFWTGYTGADDFFYSRYAWELHRPPINHWEFRMPAVLAIRTSFLVFGPTEVAAALPSLMASLIMLGAVAWFVDWPRKMTWQSTSSMLLLSLVPLDVAFRSFPHAPFMSSSLLALGTMCMLKGARRIQFVGSGLLALGFLTHEVSFFYVAIFCLTALAFDRRRYWQPVFLCVFLSGCVFTAECLTYNYLLGEPFARFRTAADMMPKRVAGQDPTRGLFGIWYFLWPLKNVVFCKQFGFTMLLAFGSGLLVWKRLISEQRILLVSTLLIWFWLGYGSQVPWAYKPLGRAFHYYAMVAVGVAALMPLTLGLLFSKREWMARVLVVLTLASLLMNNAAGGRWGQYVDVSRDLLAYSKSHADRNFLTDINTMNQMYVLNGFELPDNVVCLNGPEVAKHLLINKEPVETPRFKFDEPTINAILVNREGIATERKPFEIFTNYLEQYDGEAVKISPVRYRLLFQPFVRFMEPKGFMIRSQGGDVVEVEN